MIPEDFDKLNLRVKNILNSEKEGINSVDTVEALRIIKRYNRMFGNYESIEEYKSVQDHSEFFDSMSLYGMTMLLSGHNLMGKEHNISHLLRYLDTNNHNHTMLKESIEGIFQDILWMFQSRPEGNDGSRKNRGENDFIFNQLQRIYKDNSYKNLTIDLSLTSSKATLIHGGANEAVHIITSLIQNALYWAENNVTVKLVNLKDYPACDVAYTSDYAFIVSNDGEPIEKEKRKNLFKHGFSGRKNGNGVGLMLSQRIGKKKHLHLSYDENNVFGNDTNFVLMFRTNDI